LPTIARFVPVCFVACVFVAAFRPLGAAVVTMDIDEEFRGRAFGLQTSATTAGGLVGPLLAGAVGDVLGRGAVFIALGLLLLISPLAVARRMEAARASMGAGARSGEIGRAHV